MEEKRFEKRLIKELRGFGMYATHVDTSIPGFPDIFCVCHGTLALIEVKDLDRMRDPGTIFELSQPQFYYTVKYKHGFKNIFVLFGDKNGGKLYRIEFDIEAMSLKPGIEGSYWVIAEWLKETLDAHSEPGA